MSNEYQPIANDFFEKLATKQADLAIKALFQDNPWMLHSMDDISYLKSQFVSIESAIGEYIDYHLLIDKVISNRYAIQYYLVVYERQPIKIQFQYYKPRDKWRVQNFNFSAEITEELSNAVGSYLHYVFE